MDISGILPLPSPSSSHHCQKRVTAVTPTVPTTLGSHRSAHPTIKAKALSDRTDNSEQNPTKNGQKKHHTRPHAPPEFFASRARATRAVLLTHAPHAPVQQAPTRPYALSRAPRARLVSRTATSALVWRQHMSFVNQTVDCWPLTLTVDQVKIFQQDLSCSVFRVDSNFGLRFYIWGL